MADIKTEIQDFNAKLADAYNTIKADVEAFVGGLRQAGKIAGEALPYVTEAFQVVGAIVTLIPGAGGIGAAMLTAATAVQEVDNAVVTADGILMDPTEAANILGKVVADALPKATPEQKRAEASRRVVKEHNVPPNTGDTLVAIQYAKTAKIDAAKKPS